MRAQVDAPARTTKTATAQAHQEHRWPRVERCTGCGQHVVVALRRGGRLVVLEPWPLIVGIERCQWCRGRRERAVPEYAKTGPVSTMPGDLAGRMTKGSITSCPSCGGTGVRGVMLTRKHVVMAIDGVCRSKPLMVAPWDSAYERHVCPGGNGNGRHDGPVARANGHRAC